MVISTNDIITPATMSEEPVYAKAKLDVPFIKKVSGVISPEEVKYVSDVKNVIDTCETCGCDGEECIDILFVTKIIAFADKFRVLHWAAKNHSEHVILDKFIKDMENFKDTIAEVLQGIGGQFKASHELFQHINLPLGDSSLHVMDELKNVITEWFFTREDNIDYEGARNTVSGFLEIIYKNIYLLRLAR